MEIGRVSFVHVVDRFLSVFEVWFGGTTFKVLKCRGSKSDAKTHGSP